MSALPFVILAVVLSLGAQQPTTPTPPPGKGKVVSVEIVVDTIDNHEKSCKAGKVQPTTVLVAGKAVRHCVNNTLLDHDVDEARNHGIVSRVVFVMKPTTCCVTPLVGAFVALVDCSTAAAASSRSAADASAGRPTAPTAPRVARSKNCLRVRCIVLSR